MTYVSPIAGGLFSPLDHSSGAFGLLGSLLQGSLPAPQRPPVPTIPALAAAQQQQQHATAAEAPGQREQENAVVPQPHRLSTKGAAADNADARPTSAAQLGGRLQRLRLPDFTGSGKAGSATAAAAALGVQRAGSAGNAGGADSARNSGRQPLAARQLPKTDSKSSGETPRLIYIAR